MLFEVFRVSYTLLFPFSVTSSLWILLEENLSPSQMVILAFNFLSGFPLFVIYVFNFCFCSYNFLSFMSFHSCHCSGSIFLR